VLEGVVEFYAIDPVIRADVKKHLECAKDEDLSVSGLMRFGGGKHSLDEAAKDRIDKFVARLDKQTSKWGVFGFASEEGNAEQNRKLSWQRACEVKRYICKKRGCSSCDAGCKTYLKDKSLKMEAEHKCTGASGDRKTDFPIICLGEEHFINGVADSRSVAIAACGKED